MNNVQLSAMSKKQSTKSKRGKYQVTLHNDNHNTFDHVVYCLVEACGHNEMQAHQCALIVHNVGQCVVFIDCYEECESVHEYFLKNKLKSTLEKHVKKNS